MKIETILNAYDKVTIKLMQGYRGYFVQSNRRARQRTAFRARILQMDSEHESLHDVHRKMIEDSNNLMSWWGDAEFDGKEIGAYIITWLPERDPKRHREEIAEMLK